MMERLLRSLRPQLCADIEVVIRDDSTNDETEKVITQYLKSENFRYFHGKKEGLDVAVIHLLNQSRGKFVWWFGNEVFASSGLSKVINILKTDNKIDFLYVNSSDTNGNISINLGESHYFKNKDKVIEQVADLLGFISAIIFKRENAVPGVESSKKFIGSAWVNLYLVMRALSNSNKAYFLSDVCFISDPKNPEEKLWYDRFQVFAVNFFKVVCEFKGFFGKKSMRYMLKKNFESVWKGILVHRAAGYKSSFGSDSPKLATLLTLYWNFLEFWVFFPFFIMPKPILGFFYKFYKILFPNPKNRLGLR